MACQRPAPKGNQTNFTFYDSGPVTQKKNLKEKLLYTWTDSPPIDAPTCLRLLGICLELNLDDVGVARDLSRQGGAAGLPHQERPVSVFDLQVVILTSGMRLDVEGSEN